MKNPSLGDYLLREGKLAKIPEMAKDVAVKMAKLTEFLNKD